MIDINDAASISKVFRQVIKHYAKKVCLPPVPEDAVLMQEGGLYVTLLDSDSGDTLRYGSFLGNPSDIRQALARSAMDVCGRKGLFPPASPRELSKLLMEFAVLYDVRRIDAFEDNLSALDSLGKRGLAGRSSKEGELSFLMPGELSKLSHDVALAAICSKAGLTRRAWTRDRFEIYTFEALCFRETKPSSKKLEEISIFDLRVV